MRKMTVTLGIAVAFLGCSNPKQVVPENLMETFQTTRPAADVRAVALDILVAEGFRILAEDDEVVRASREQCRQSSYEFDGVRPVYCDVFTVVVVQSHATQDRVEVRVGAYRERESSRSPDERSLTAATLDEVHWCETVAEKLKRALGQPGM
jgi:hypothetical protein